MPEGHGVVAPVDTNSLRTGTIVVGEPVPAGLSLVSSFTCPPGYTPTKKHTHPVGAAGIVRFPADAVPPVPTFIVNAAVPFACEILAPVPNPL